MKYVARPGSIITDEQADLVGKELESMQKAGVYATPAALVERAHNPEHPLHGLFQWDDKAAGEKWRLEQARSLIGSVQVVIEMKKPKKAYFSVRVESKELDAPSREYISRKEVLVNSNHRHELAVAFYQRIAAACREAESLGLHKEFPELQRIISVVKVSEVKTVAVAVAGK